MWLKKPKLSKTLEPLKLIKPRLASGYYHFRNNYTYDSSGLGPFPSLLSIEDEFSESDMWGQVGSPVGDIAIGDDVINTFGVVGKVLELDGDKVKVLFDGADDPVWILKENLGLVDSSEEVQQLVEPENVKDKGV